MNTKEEIIAWEKEHFDQIIGWSSEYDVKPNIKVLTFNYRIINNPKVQKKTFEVQQ